MIVAQVLTEGNADDAKTALDLIDAIDGDLSSLPADVAYDTVALYEAASARGANVIVPPTKTAAVSRNKPRSTARDQTIRRVKEVGRRRWKKESGYHRQGTVENAFFRYKSIIGEHLRARSPGGQTSEADLACNILNQMTALGSPASCRIGG